MCICVSVEAPGILYVSIPDPCRRDRPLRDALLCNSAGCSFFVGGLGLGNKSRSAPRPASNLPMRGLLLVLWELRSWCRTSSSKHFSTCRSKKSRRLTKEAIQLLRAGQNCSAEARETGWSKSRIVHGDRHCLSLGRSAVDRRVSPHRQEPKAPSRNLCLCETFTVLTALVSCLCSCSSGSSVCKRPHKRLKTLTPSTTSRVLSNVFFNGPRAGINMNDGSWAHGNAFDEGKDFCR